MNNLFFSFNVLEKKNKKIKLLREVYTSSVILDINNNNNNNNNNNENIKNINNLNLKKKEFKNVKLKTQAKAMAKERELSLRLFETKDYISFLNEIGLEEKDIIKLDNMVEKNSLLKKVFLLVIYEKYIEKRKKKKKRYNDKTIDDLKIFYDYKFIDFIKKKDNEDQLLFEDNYGFFKNILDSLEEGKIYKLSYRFESVIEVNDNKIRVFNSAPSVFLHKNSEISGLIYKLKNKYLEYSMKYGFENYLSVDFFVKEWIKSEDIKNFKEILKRIVEMEEVFNKKIIDSERNLLNIYRNKNKIKSLFNKDLNNIFKTNNLAVDICGLSYGNLLLNDDLYNIFNIKDKSLFDFYSKTYNNINYILKIDKTNNNLYLVNCYLEKDLLNNNLSDSLNLFSLDSWEDSIYYDKENNNQIVDRSTKEFNIKFVNNLIVNIEIKYNSKFLLESYLDNGLNSNLGVFDIETYKDKDNIAIPFCIAFKSPNMIGKNNYYLSDYNNVNDMMFKFLNDLMVKNNHNLMLYAHNMSGFDGIIFLNFLLNNKDLHNLKINISDNSDGDLLSIIITKKIENKKVVRVTILDSFQILPISLNKASKLFSTDVKKGYFPYDFVNLENINYVGDVPSYDYYNQQMSYEEYLNYKSFFIQWNLKEETLKYINRDIDSLYEVIHKFNVLIFDNFNINISRIKTYSGLAFLIYTSNYYLKNKSHNKICLLNNKVDKYIREAYYGGIVDVCVNYTDYLTYKYDVNSHYPYAMLNALPGGIPRLSNEKNIKNIFGFVEAIVKAPEEYKLKVPILPVKKDGETKLFRGYAKGVWFSEELKMALEYGYEIVEIYTCLQFDKVNNLFDEYILNMFKHKKNNNNNEGFRYIFKLLLNSLYGRTGLKDKKSQLSIVDNDNLEKLNKIENIDVLLKGKNFNLVKSQGPLDPEIIRIIKDENLTSQLRFYEDSRNKWVNYNSTVHLAASITAYARMFLNKYKNMKDNPYLGGDTDSIILTYPLKEVEIGDDVGQFKLEYIIKEAFYHSKKFYLIKTVDDVIVIKSKGFNNINNIINFESFIKLFKGEDLTLKQTQFNINFNDLNVSINNINKTIPGIKDKNINDLIKKKYS